jgi:exonuclease SbcC
MKLKSLRLRNIRSHRDTEVDFGKGITVFTGRTGSGKSSIMMGVSYALFGSEARIPNSELLRRGSKSGHVELEFEHRSSVYLVRRGLKEYGENVTVDTSNLSIDVNGERLPLLGRASDLNEKIVDVLGYPKGIDPVKLFEVTTYSKQDEIRKLIEMRPAERQKYIDKLLQIQRYQNTWEGMKDVLGHFIREKDRMEERMKGEERVAKQIEEFGNRIANLDAKIKRVGDGLARKSKDLEVTKSKLEMVEKEEGKFKVLRSEYDALDARIASLNSEFLSSKAKVEALKNKIGMTKVPKAGETEKMVARGAEIRSAISFSNKELKELPEKMRKLDSLGNRCPLCGSEITPEHRKKIEDEYGSKMDGLRKNVSKLSEELAEVSKEVDRAKRRDDIMNILESDRRMLDEKEREMNRLEQELRELRKKFVLVEGEVKGYDNEKIGSIRDRYNVLSAEVAGLKSGLEAHEEEKRRNLSDILELEKELEKFAALKKDLGKMDLLVKVLSKLRDDIREIRERVRTRFLSEFKVEFQAKFEEIRQFEDDYSVDVKSDYEPIAYSQREEVSVTTLSGGEKTSVALAYRLALADIAAQIGGVSESEVLMLDEPTTGFDSDDIRALPEALKNIKTIPQIVIVTHAEELKEAADYLFNVEKVRGVSKVKEVVT